MEKEELLKEIEEIIKQREIVNTNSAQVLMKDLKLESATLEDLQYFKKTLLENKEISITLNQGLINEEALLEWQEKNKKPKQSLYSKVNTAIANYFKEVNYNFTEWKRWMRGNVVLLDICNYDYFNRKYIVTPKLFNPKYFESISYVKYRSPYQVYSKLAKNPTVTEFVKFVDNWKDGVTRGFPKSGKVFSDFEDMFIDVD
jgi:hypothetical protein